MTRTDHIQAICFDIGGTLLDFDTPESWGMVQAGMNAAYAYVCEIGKTPPARRSYRRRLTTRLVRAAAWAACRRAELNTDHQLRAAHAAMGIPLDDAELAELGRRFYAPAAAITRPAPDSAAALATLQQRGYVLALISNTIAPPSGLDHVLAGHGLLDFFDVRIYSCVVGVAKPHRRIFVTALDRIGMSPAQAMYIGDKPRIDVRGAGRVGMTTVLRAPDGGDASATPRPDHLIRQIPELLDLLPGRQLAETG